MSAEYVSVHNQETWKKKEDATENDLEQAKSNDTHNPRREIEQSISYWDGDMDHDSFRCWSVLFIIGTFITIICVSLSFHYIYYDKYALRKNTVLENPSQ